MDWLEAMRAKHPEGEQGAVVSSEGAGGIIYQGNDGNCVVQGLHCHGDNAIHLSNPDDVEGILGEFEIPKEGWH